MVDISEQKEVEYALLKPCEKVRSGDKKANDETNILIKNTKKWPLLHYRCAPIISGHTALSIPAPHTIRL